FPVDCTDAYRYGYDIGKTGNFHHETRGPDGVTYGCYGHIDPNKILRATHYVADTRGYRTVEPQKPVVTYPEADDPIKGPSSGILLQWDELYFPIGCGKFEGGVRPDIPLVFIDDGTDNHVFNFTKFTHLTPKDSKQNGLNAHSNNGGRPVHSSAGLFDNSHTYEGSPGAQASTTHAIQSLYPSGDNQVKNVASGQLNHFAITHNKSADGQGFGNFQGPGSKHTGDRKNSGTHGHLDFKGFEGSNTPTSQSRPSTQHENSLDYVLHGSSSSHHPVETHSNGFQGSGGSASSAGFASSVGSGGLGSAGSSSNGSRDPSNFGGSTSFASFDGPGGSGGSRSPGGGGVFSGSGGLGVSGSSIGFPGPGSSNSYASHAGSGGSDGPGGLPDSGNNASFGGSANYVGSGGSGKYSGSHGSGNYANFGGTGSSNKSAGTISSVNSTGSVGSVGYVGSVSSVSSVDSSGSMDSVISVDHVTSVDATTSAGIAGSADSVGSAGSESYTGTDPSGSPSSHDLFKPGSHNSIETQRPSGLFDSEGSGKYEPSPSASFTEFTKYESNDFPALSLDGATTLSGSSSDFLGKYGSDSRPGSGSPG
ncbi:PE-PGRS family protein PE_PGRS16-like, partial [Glossina fuscipes]|uniref:PE-PGRS family protein PE_PGRS16-like n=1 Tax=Glossina fuscipes TaxID=7396 RepID=A0A8U0W750_9MUSC